MQSVVSALRYATKRVSLLSPSLCFSPSQLELIRNEQLELDAALVALVMSTDDGL